VPPYCHPCANTLIRGYAGRNCPVSPITLASGLSSSMTCSRQTACTHHLPMSSFQSFPTFKIKKKKKVSALGVLRRTSFLSSRPCARTFSSRMSVGLSIDSLSDERTVRNNRAQTFSVNWFRRVDARASPILHKYAANAETRCK